MLMVTEGTFRGLGPILLTLSAALNSHLPEQGDGAAGGGGSSELCAQELGLLVAGGERGG